MEPLADEPVGLPGVGKRSSLRGQVADALRAAMVAGKMHPGVVYSAPALADEFGVSATPVREAMIDLVNEGLVEAVRNRGFRVVPLSARELDEITQMRELVEVPAIDMIIGRLDTQRAERLRSIADEITAEAERGDLVRYIDADRRFHAGLLELTGNRTLVRMALDLRARSRLYGLAKLLERSALIDSAVEHAELLDALLAGDADKARATLRQHLNHVRHDWA